MRTTVFFPPEGVSVDSATGRLASCANHYEKRLSQVRGLFRNGGACEALLETRGDIITYEVYECVKSEADGDIIFGSSIVYSGKVGNEYFMTKGHSHAKSDRAEIYYCISGNGLMLLESPDGKTRAVAMSRGVIVYVPPHWKHRSVNTGRRKLISIFAYPADAGHVYGEIEKKGMRKMVVEVRGKPRLQDNPAYGRP